MVNSIIEENCIEDNTVNIKSPTDFQDNKNQTTF